MKIFKWIKESNRWKHLLYAIPIGAVCGILSAVIVASALEYKDTQGGGKWDWLDWIATVIGGAIGLIIKILYYYEF